MSAQYIRNIIARLDIKPIWYEFSYLWDRQVNPVLNIKDAFNLLIPHAVAEIVGIETNEIIPQNLSEIFNDEKFNKLFVSKVERAISGPSLERIITPINRAYDVGAFEPSPSEEIRKLQQELYNAIP